MKGPILAYDAGDQARGPRKPGDLPSFLQRRPAAMAEPPAAVVEPAAATPAAPAVLTAVPAAPEPAAPAQVTLTAVAATPAPEPKALFEAKARARADLSAFYAGMMGVELSHGDLLERMVLAGGDQVTPGVIAAALTGAGLRARVIRDARPQPKMWPALAEMTSGQVVLVLEQRGDILFIYDKTCPGDRAEVPLAEFQPVFAGTVIRAHAGVAELARRHAGPAEKPHWFWGQFARFRRSFGEVALGSLVANLLAAAVALFSLQVYDRVIPHQSTATLWVLALGCFIALILEGALRVARARLMDNSGKKIELGLQEMFLDRILGMRADRRQAPAMQMAAMRDFSSVREFFTASTVGALTDLPFVFLFLALVAMIAGPVVWILVIGGILMVLPSFLAQKKMVALTRASQGASARQGRLLNEVIYDIDTIKSARGEDRFRRTWSELNLLSAASTSENRKLSSMLTYWAAGVQQATYVAAVVAGAYMVFAGQFTVGTIIATGILTSRTLGPLTQLAGMLSRWANVKGALTALDGIVDAEQDEAEGRTYLRRARIEGRFELREVAFSYDKDAARSLDINALGIEPGQRVAVLGVNGSGKSTFLKLLSGLYRPEKGLVLVDGVDMGQIMPRDLRRSIGYLGQEVRLFAGTLRDNLNLTMLERDDDRLLAALDFAGLGQYVRSHPKGLDLPISDGGEGLSVGQRQSLGWARLWLQDPSVVLLDEPTAAMDQTLEATLVARLDQWLEGRTAVIATHRMPILNLATRVSVMQAGRIVVDGPKAEVLAHLNRTAGNAAAAGGSRR